MNTGFNIKSKFQPKLKTKDIVMLGLLLALKIVLVRITSISFGIVRISFGFIATGLIGYLYGPYLGLATGVMGDLIGFFLFPNGTYFPGYTLTAAVSGTIYGSVLHKKKPSFLRIFIACSIVCIVCNLCLNTLWTSILYGKAFWAILPPRLLKNVLLIPIESSVLFMLLKYLLPFIRIFNLTPRHSS